MGKLLIHTYVYEIFIKKILKYVDVIISIKRHYKFRHAKKNVTVTILMTTSICTLAKIGRKSCSVHFVGYH